MGELDEGNIYETSTQGKKRNSKLIAAIMLLLGLFAPLTIQIFGYGWGPPQTYIQSLFWMYYSNSMGSFGGFTIIPPYALMSMFPLILFRIAPVYQIWRYYNEKTTRKRAMIACFVGDGIFLIMTIPYILLAMMGMFMLPLPFQLIFGLLVLWRYPISEPTAPWKSEDEPKSWWEKPSDSQKEKPDERKAEQKKPTDNDDVLW